MCGPLLGIAAGAVSAIGTAAAGGQQAAAKRREAQSLEIDAIVQRQQGIARADQLNDENKELIGSQRVAAAASGVDVSTGSVSRVIDQETPSDHYLDEQLTIWNAETVANQRENQADSKRAEADAIEKGAQISAFSSILSSGRSLATQLR